MVHVQPTDRSSEVESFIRAYTDALTSSERRIKAVLFCNPHNPRGDLYPRKHIEALLLFCQTYGLHFISDEIYGLSTFQDGGSDNGKGFVSVLQCDLAALGVEPALVHMIYSISKDMGSSGLRLVCVKTSSSVSLLANFKRLTCMAAAGISCYSSTPRSSPFTSHIEPLQSLDAHIHSCYCATIRRERSQ